MNPFEKITLIIPSLDPDGKLLEVLEGVQAEGFSDFLLVDDGSAPENQHYFEEAAERFGCTVLHHEKNRGKGRALKTAFEWYQKNRPDFQGCVTVDGDNQHHPKDIAACVKKMLDGGCKALILGVRDFNGPNVPKKSRFGNHLTSNVFRLFCGLHISDTQTGLRVFPHNSMPLMLEISGERFEYETNMLLSCKNAGLPMEELSIRTIYIDENATTHFHPIRDSLKVYGIILRFFAASIASFVLDFGLFNLLYALTKQKLFLSTVIARVCSSLFNYTINRKAVFRSKTSMGSTLWRYYILCALQMLTSYGLVALLTKWLGEGNGIVAVCKFVVDMLLYFVSFRVQQAWVFREKKFNKE